MKRLLLILFLILLPSAAMAEESAAPSDGETAQRLEALRYTLSPAVSLTASEIQALLENDLFDAPRSSSDLFETDADFGPLELPGETPYSADVFSALPLGWDEAQKLLSPNDICSLTEQRTGAAIRLRYAGVFDDAAIFQPVTGWDAASLGSIFSDCYDFRVIPCVLTVGTERYLAGLSVTPAEVDEASKTPLLCRLYFEGAAPSLGNIPGLGME